MFDFCLSAVCSLDSVKNNIENHKLHETPYQLKENVSGSPSMISVSCYDLLYAMYSRKRLWTHVISCTLLLLSYLLWKIDNKFQVFLANGSEQLDSNCFRTKNTELTSYYFLIYVTNGTNSCNVCFGKFLFGSNANEIK